MGMKGEENMSEKDYLKKLNKKAEADIEKNQYTLDLVNSWINSADQKIGTAFGIFSVVFAAFGFLAGSKLTELRETNCCWYYVLLVLSIISIVAFVSGLAFFFFALKPNFQSDNKECKYSIFYEEIKSFSKASDYIEVCSKATDSQFNEELCKEIFYNSKICSKKMHSFKNGLIISSIAILIAIFIVTILLILG